MTEVQEKLTGSFWIEGCRVDPAGLKVDTGNGEFSLEPKVMQVLVLLASRAGEVVTRQALIEEVWAVTYGGDESLTRAISVLRKTLGDTNGRRTLIETVPRRGYRLVGAVSQNGPAAAMTGEPRETAEPPDLSAKEPAPTLPVWQWAVIATVSLTIMVLAGLFILRGGRPAEPSTVITVPLESVWIAPFETADEDGALGTFAKGLRSKLSSLYLASGVIAVFEEGAGDETQKFDLDGDIAVHGSIVQVNVRLIDHRSQLIVWSQVFERDEAELDYFADEIAGLAAFVTRCIRDMRPDAFAAEAATLVPYARYCNGPRRGYVPSLTAYTEAIYQADPENPTARLWHAYGLGVDAERGFLLAEEDKAALRAQAKALIEPVLAEDPDSDFGNFVLGVSEPIIGNWEAAEEKLVAAATAEGASDTALYHYAEFLYSVGRRIEYFQLLQDMISRNPVDYSARRELGAYLSIIRQESWADEEFDIAGRYDPHSGWVDYERYHKAIFYGTTAEALEAIGAMERDEVNMARMSRGEIDCGRKYIEERTAATPDLDGLEEACAQSRINWRVRMFTMLGDLDRAFDYTRHWNMKQWRVSVLLYYPEMAPMRHDPRFWIMAEEAGLVTYWRDTGHWPDFCQYDQPAIDCPAMANAVLSGLTATLETVN